MQAEDRDAYVADDAAIAAALRDDEAILDVYQETGGADIWRRPPTADRPPSSDHLTGVRSPAPGPDDAAPSRPQSPIEPVAEPPRRRPSTAEAPAPSIPGDAKWVKSCRPHTTKKTPEKWRLYNESLLCLAQNDYEGAAQILEPLTDQYNRKAPFREDPDALFRMAQVSLCRMRRDESLNWPAAAWLDEERPPSMRERLSSVRTKMRTFGSFGSRKDESLDERPVSLGDAPIKKKRGSFASAAKALSRLGLGRAPAPAPAAFVDPMVAVAQKELAAAIAAPGTQYRKRRKARALQIIHSYLDRALQAIEAHAIKNDCDDCWRRIQLERMNLYLEHGDERQAYEIAKQRDLVLFEPEAALYLAERYLEEGRDDEASALTRRAVRWHAHTQKIQGFVNETPPEVSHDLDWAFGDVNQRNPFLASDEVDPVEEEAAPTKRSVWASPDITRPAAAPTVWRPGRTELDADVAREDGALAAITFGRRELEIPDKKPPRGGVLHFPGSDTLDDSSFRG
jgi:hypothetical protein